MPVKYDREKAAMFARRPIKKKKETIARSLLGDNGVRFIPLNLTPQRGRILRDIIDGDGRVFKPNPYNIPNDPQRVLVFAAHLIIAMMDCDRLEYGQNKHFTTKEEWMRYRTLTMELIAGMDAMRIINNEPMIEYQKPGGDI